MERRKKEGKEEEKDENEDDGKSISKNCKISCSKNNIIAIILYLPVIVVIINSIDLVFSRHL